MIRANRFARIVSRIARATKVVFPLSTNGVGGEGDRFVMTFSDVFLPVPFFSEKKSPRP